MRSLSGREFASIVERHGWTLLRVKGSHHIYGKQGSVVRLSIPFHGTKPLKVELLRHLLKMAGLEEVELSRPSSFQWDARPACLRDRQRRSTGPQPHPEEQAHARLVAMALLRIEAGVNSRTAIRLNHRMSKDGGGIEPKR